MEGLLSWNPSCRLWWVVVAVGATHLAYAEDGPPVELRTRPFTVEGTYQALHPLRGEGTGSSTTIRWTSDGSVAWLLGTVDYELSPEEAMAAKVPLGWRERSTAARYDLAAQVATHCTVSAYYRANEGVLTVSEPALDGFTEPMATDTFWSLWWPLVGGAGVAATPPLLEGTPLAMTGRKGPGGPVVTATRYVATYDATLAAEARKAFEQCTSDDFD